MFSPQIPDERMYELMLLDLGSYSDVLLNSTTFHLHGFQQQLQTVPHVSIIKKRSLQILILEKLFVVSVVR